MVGYLTYHLKDKEGKIKAKKIHRLVAKTFIPNPNNYPVVNHINGNKLDNRIDNLEWCTISHNNKEAYRLGLRKVSPKTIEQFRRDCLKHKNIEIAIENLRKSKMKAVERAKKVNSKKICIYNEAFYKEFESEVQACNYLGVHKGSVDRVAKNPKWKVKGYYAKYI